MHQLLPQLIGSFLTASAQKPGLFAEMKEVNHSIIEIDSRIGQHIAEVRKTGNEDGAMLTELHHQVNRLRYEVPEKFEGFMRTPILARRTPQKPD